MSYKSLPSTWDFSQTRGRTYVSFKDPFTQQNTVRNVRSKMNISKQVKEGYLDRGTSVNVPAGTQTVVQDHSEEAGSYNLPFSTARYVPPVINYNDYIDLDETTTALGTSITALEGRVTVNEGDISSNLTSITSNTAGITSNTASIGILSGRIDNIDSNITNIDVDIQNLLSRVQTTEGNVVILDGLIKDVDERTQFIHCQPGVGCIVYDKATGQPLTMYADTFKKKNALP